MGLKRSPKGSGSCVVSFAAVLLAILPIAPSSADESLQGGLVGWEKMGSEDGIDVFRREITGSPIVALRGEGIVDAPLSRVASVVLDEARATEWVDSLSETQVLKAFGPREFLQYSHIGTPIVIKDRDFLTRDTIEFEPKDGTLLLKIRSVEDPLKPEGKYVRGTLDGYWKLRSIAEGRKTYVIAEMHADPKGTMPRWLVNLFQKTWPRKTIESLRTQVAKKDIQVLPQVAAVLGEKPVVTSAAKPLEAKPQALKQ